VVAVVAATIEGVVVVVVATEAPLATIEIRVAEGPLGTIAIAPRQSVAQRTRPTREEIPLIRIVFS
jgi:hypothetical protein